MESLIIKVDNTANVAFLTELLSKFKFVKAIEPSKKKLNGIKEVYKNLPIQWATQSPNIDDFTNIIKDRKLSLSEIREKAWKRS